MGEESLRKRKGEDSGEEDGQSIQSDEPRKTNLQKQAKLFPSPSVCVRARGWQSGVSVHTSHNSRNCAPV